MPDDRRLAVAETKAAYLLDMSRARFLRLVEIGALPKPKIIGGDARWNVDELDAIARGEASLPKSEDIEV